MPKHFLAPTDLDRDGILRILHHATQAEQGILSLERKVLSLLFLSESTRTASSLKAAIIKAGGGWIGIEGLDGTYLRSKSESVLDTANYLSVFSNFLAVRGDINPDTFRDISIPVLNAGLGDDHCIVGVWLLYTLSNQFTTLNGLKIGVIGLTRYSTAIKSVYRLLSKFEIEFYEDSIIQNAGSQAEIIETIFSNGSVFNKGRLSKFINTVDCLIITDCLSQEGADDSIVREFNREFRTVDAGIISKLKSKSFWLYFMPRTTTDGRLTITTDLDYHPKLINDIFFRDSVFCNIGILYELSQSSK